MTAHLLALTVGPVQEFIAAARRTRDLWFGSYLLAEISKAAARAVADAVADGRGELIFPMPASAADLEPDSAFNVANMIVAELRGHEPAAVARAAKHAAQARWRNFADQVFKRNHAVIVDDVWNDQVDDVLEFYAAWVVQSSESYKADRALLMRLLMGRKNCRDFLPARGRAGVPKSSLDGLRESVLTKPEEWPERSRRRMRTRPGEQLDVVALVKRTWAPLDGTPRYPSVARVAADPWIRGVGEARLAHLCAACEWVGEDAVHRVDVSIDRGHPHHAAFPFEGTVVFRSRYIDLQEEAELTDTHMKRLVDALVPLTREHGEPEPYLAVLVADGDRMSESISRLASAGEHRQFSQALARFAAATRDIVHAHSGVLVYAGGDDVLGFVPVDRCLACARALHETFQETLAAWSEKTGTELSLSVGVAIAHFMEPLEDLLEYGRAAEKHAKRPRAEETGQHERNGLAVHVLKRGGEPLMTRANWTDRSDERIQTLARWLAARAVPTRVAYDLRKLADVYDAWPPATVTDALQRDTLSVMRGKDPAVESKMDEVAILIEKHVVDAPSLRRLSAELLVARQLAAAMKQAGGDDAPAGEDAWRPG